MFFPAVIALFLLGVGIAALSLNAKRAMNLISAAVCFAGVLFFATQLTAKYEAAKYVATGVGSPLFWVRVKFAIVALISPTLVWLCYYVASGRYDNRRHLVRKMIPWICLSCCLGAIAFTQGFKPNDSLPGHERYGPLFVAFFGPMLVGQLAVCLASIGVAGRLTGLRRLEFQFIALPLGYLSLVAVTVDLYYAVWPVPWLHTVTRVVSYLVCVVFGISAWSVNSHRVYRQQQVLSTIVQRMIVIGPIALLGYEVAAIIQRRENSVAPAAAIIGIAMLVAFTLDDRIRARFRLQFENRITELSIQLHNVAGRQTSPETLIEHFELLLSTLTKAPACILVREGEEYRRGPHCIPVEMIRERSTVKDCWYSLTARSRVRGGDDEELREYLERRKWAALVFPGWESNSTLLLAIAERENCLPFTFPELRELRTLTNVVEALYTRCRLALQARQAEQLVAIGKMGVSIAHELRNPMWTLASFSQLLPERLDDPEFLRSFATIVPDEAKRIEALAEQLLDLARPRQYNLVQADVHAIIEQTVILLRPQFSATGVEIITEQRAEDPEAVVDKDGIRQILLNLIKNAAEALQSTPLHQRRIQVRTNCAGSHLQIEVEDEGPGIPQSLRAKLFTPFASAEKQSGLGLGLAVCKEIVAVHGGEILATDGVNGGTLIRVTLPRWSGVSPADTRKLQPLAIGTT